MHKGLCEAHNFVLMVVFTEEIHDTKTEQNMKQSK